MSNFDAYRNILKKFQRWPHSLLTMWGQCMTFVVGELEVQWHFKRVPTKILQMETMTFEKYETLHYKHCFKHGQSQSLCGRDIKHPWFLSPPILSRHVSSLTTSNFDAYRHILKKFQRWPHSLVLTMWDWCMTFVVVELEVPWHFKRVPQRLYEWKQRHLKNMRHPIINVVANMDDLNDYVPGTSNILESWNPLIPSRHVSSLAM